MDLPLILGLLACLIGGVVAFAFVAAGLSMLFRSWKWCIRFAFPSLRSKR